jgi:hypothetical protein
VARPVTSARAAGPRRSGSWQPRAVWTFPCIQVEGAEPAMTSDSEDHNYSPSGFGTPGSLTGPCHGPWTVTVTGPGPGHLRVTRTRNCPISEPESEHERLQPSRAGRSPAAPRGPGRVTEVTLPVAPRSRVPPRAGPPAPRRPGRPPARRQRPRRRWRWVAGRAEHCAPNVKSGHAGPV